MEEKKMKEEQEESQAKKDQKSTKETVDQDNKKKTAEEKPKKSKGRKKSKSAEEIEKLQSELNEFRDKYLRIYSEFDNFRKRTNKERVDLIKMAGSEVIMSLLPVLDDLQRASKAFEQSSDEDALKTGVDLVFGKLKNTLTQKGLKEMECIGEEFDTDVHEAITQIPAPKEDDKGKVIDEIEKGYFLNDKVLRYAKVVVGV